MYAVDRKVDVAGTLCIENTASLPRDQNPAPIRCHAAPCGTLTLRDFT